MRKFQSTIVLIFFSVLLSGCARELIPTSIASIEPSTGWAIEENCGYEGCYPLVDYLKGEYISIRFDLYNTKYHAKQSHFSIQLSFTIPNEKRCFYNPPNTQLIYREKNTIFPFRFGSHGEFRFESNEKLIEPIELTGQEIPGYGAKLHSISLDFPVENLSPNESFSLKINDFICDGKEMYLPIVNFSKGMRK